MPTKRKAKLISKYIQQLDKILHEAKVNLDIYQHDDLKLLLAKYAKDPRNILSFADIAEVTANMDDIGRYAAHG